MTSCIYGVVRETYELGELRRLSFGIVCYANPEEDGTLAIVASVHDISADYDAVRRLADLCNRLALSPLHLRDVIEDSIW